jgi:hypothetical protein
MLGRLPLTFRAFIGVEASRWATSFPAERAYLAALLEALAASDLAEAFRGVAALEAQAGCRDVKDGDPRRVQDETQALLRRKGLLPRWRLEVERVFQGVQPRIDERLHPPGAPRRVVMVIYATGIAIQRDRLWSRLRAAGARIPLRLDGQARSEAFLRGLLGRADGETLFSALSADAWCIEAGEALHALSAGAPEAARPVGLSYERLRPYREGLARALYKKVTSGVSGPQELAAFAREMGAEPPPGTLLRTDERLVSFVRDVLLGGNGALLVSNTFVEWAAVQAIKRAEPRLLVARFGVRDKMKPFSSLLLFSSPRASDQVPILEDPFGSFVDAEQLGYYVWLNAEKSAAYRGRTLYLLLAEGVDEMLAIRSDHPRPASEPPGEAPAATLAEVGATMAAWLGLDPAATAAPIASLAG